MTVLVTPEAFQSRGPVVLECRRSLRLNGEPADLAGPTAQDEPAKRLEGDDEAQLAVIAISGPNTGKALRDEIGTDQPGYDYIMKRIRRTLAKKFPKGFPT